LAWLSTRYSLQLDWTAGARNTLSPASLELLARLDGPIEVTSFARDQRTLRGPIEDLLGRYRRAKSDLRLTFVNPDLAPEQVRAQAITVDGELVIRYQGRSENVRELTEQAITNALERLARGGERAVVFVAGHGERQPDGEANHDYARFAAQLARKGMVPTAITLAAAGSVPENTRVLVIADPRFALLPMEVELIRRWLEQGGNLLWLGEPASQGGLEPIAEALGVRFEPGVVVDATTRLRNIDDPTFALVTSYATEHPVTREFAAVTLFPRSAALAAEAAPQGRWRITPVLQTQARSWTEVGAIQGEIGFDADAGERRGPLTIGLGLTRDHPLAAGSDGASAKVRQQRVMVVGDADFLANAYLGNGGNLQLGLNMFNWLSQDDRFIAIPVKSAPDRELALSGTAKAVIGLGILFVLPAALLTTAAVIGWRRRRR
jgi:ABC-type uncharacterized transport system involved in gliding motility auxiliary subunit